MSREDCLKRMAQAYHDLLKVLAPLMKKDDNIIFNGLREGLNKFLSNVYISLVHNKRETDYYSEKAFEACKNNPKGKCPGLTYEHIVPKNIYQDEIVKTFSGGQEMSADEIADRLKKEWWTATITQAEDKLLKKKKMPDDWDGTNRFARYDKAGITLKTWKQWEDNQPQGIS